MNWKFVAVIPLTVGPTSPAICPGCGRCWCCGWPTGQEFYVTWNDNQTGREKP